MAPGNSALGGFLPFLPSFSFIIGKKPRPVRFLKRLVCLLLESESQRGEAEDQDWFLRGLQRREDLG